MGKANPFNGWTTEDVERHNAAIAAKVNRAFQLDAKLADIALLRGRETRQEPHKLSGLGVNPGPATNLKIAISTDERKLNKLERSWLAVLRVRQYPWVGIQNVTLKLGDDCRYTPDFSTIGPDGEMIFWETKGFMRGDAQVKLKVAARLFSWGKFYLVEKKHGQWAETEIKP